MTHIATVIKINSFHSLQLNYAGKVVTSLGPWIIRHRQAVTLPIVQKFFQVHDNISNLSEIQSIFHRLFGQRSKLLEFKLWDTVLVVSMH